MTRRGSQNGGSDLTRGLCALKCVLAAHGVPRRLSDTQRDVKMIKSVLCATLFALLTSVSVGSFAAKKTEPVESAKAAVAQSTAINLNTADAETLTRELKGIGAAKAKAIVAYREAHGPFSSVDDLLEVKGIGAATLEKNRAKLSLN